MAKKCKQFIALFNLPFTAQSLAVYRRRNTLIKEHILPSLQTAATASSTKIHHLYRRFGYLSAKSCIKFLNTLDIIMLARR